MARNRQGRRAEMQAALLVHHPPAPATLPRFGIGRIESQDEDTQLRRRVARSQASGRWRVASGGMERPKCEVRCPEEEMRVMSEGVKLAVPAAKHPAEHPTSLSAESNLKMRTRNYVEGSPVHKPAAGGEWQAAGWSVRSARSEVRGEGKCGQPWPFTINRAATLPRFGNRHCPMKR